MFGPFEPLLRAPTADDAHTAMLRLPNDLRGFAARVAYQWRALLPEGAAEAVMRAAWSHDHFHVAAAFGGASRFAEALRRVSRRPADASADVPRTLKVYRGFFGDRRGARKPSWTTSAAAACFFARFWRNRWGATKPPFVITAMAPAEAVCGLFNDRQEDEVLIATRLLDWKQVTFWQGGPFNQPLSAAERARLEEVWWEAADRYAKTHGIKV